MIFTKNETNILKNISEMLHNLTDMLQKTPDNDMSILDLKNAACQIDDIISKTPEPCAKVISILSKLPKNRGK